MVYRLDVPTASATPPAAGAVGTEGFPTAGSPPGVPPSTIDPYWHYALCEEIRNVALAGGLTPSKTALNQQLQAMKRLFGGNRTPLAVSQTLNADNAGLVVVNAATGPITITLPLAASAGGAPLEFIFIRTDTSGNAVTVVDAGSDTDAPGGATSLNVATNLPLWLRGDGASVWDVVLNISATSFAAFGVSNREKMFTSSGSWTCPAGITQIYVDAAAGGGGGAVQNSTNIAGGGGGGGGDALIDAAYTVVPGTVYPVTIGGGGAAGTGAVSGGTGGTTSLETIFSLTGGAGGTAGTAGGAGGAPGGSGGAHGAAGIYANTVTWGGYGGSSIWGAGGQMSSNTIPAAPGSGFGAGGGGGNGTGGAGAPGFIRIRY